MSRVCCVVVVLWERGSVGKNKGRNTVDRDLHHEMNTSTTLTSRTTPYPPRGFKSTPPHPRLAFRHGRLGVTTSAMGEPRRAMGEPSVSRPSVSRYAAKDCGRRSSPRSLSAPCTRSVSPGSPYLCPAHASPQFRPLPSLRAFFSCLADYLEQSHGSSKAPARLNGVVEVRPAAEPASH